MITAIVWIACPSVAHVAKLNYKVFKCVHVHPYRFYVTKFGHCYKGEFLKNKDFMLSLIHI